MAGYFRGLAAARHAHCVWPPPIVCYWGGRACVGAVTVSSHPFGQPALLFVYVVLVARWRRIRHDAPGVLLSRSSNCYSLAPSRYAWHYPLFTDFPKNRNVLDSHLDRVFSLVPKRGASPKPCNPPRTQAPPKPAPVWGGPMHNFNAGGSRLTSWLAPFACSRARS